MLVPAVRADGGPVAPDMSGRATAVLVRSPVCTQPIHCLSVYLFAGTGVEQVNRELLADVSTQFLDDQQGPVLVGCDFQEHPPPFLDGDRLGPARSTPLHCPEQHSWHVQGNRRR